MKKDKISRRDFIRITVLSFGASILAACQALQQATQTPAPRTVIIPSNTSKPSDNPDPTSTSTDTPAPTEDYYDQKVLSPNGEYVAKHYFHYRDIGGETITITDNDGEEIWKIINQLGTPTSDPWPYLVIHKWSNDSTKVFFSYLYYPDGGDYSFWWNGFDLQKINVLTGQISRVLPGEGFMSFAFSSDDSQIAYTRIQDDPSTIFIRDQSTGFTKSAIIGTEKFQITGEIHWNMRGDFVVFHLMNDEYIEQSILLNTETMQMVLIKEYEIHSAWFDGWTNNETLRYMKMPGGIVTEIDINALEEIVIGTATPQP